MRRCSTSAIALAVLILDIILKEWAQGSLVAPICLTTWMCLAVQHNPGLFLGLMPIVPGTVLDVLHWLTMPVAMVWISWRMLTLRNYTLAVGCALVIGGLVGNLSERFDGTVTDYLGVGPVVDSLWLFVNLADISLVTGVIWIGLNLDLRKYKGTEV